MSLLLSALIAASPVAGTKPDDLAVEAMHNFGACVVRTTPAGAREVLAMDFRTDEYRTKLRRLARGHGRCTRVRTELQFNGVLFAGAMAEALLEHDRKVLAGTEGLTSKIAARSDLEGMALCTVMASPAAVSKLFDTEVATKEEAEAAAALSPTLNACISDNSRAEMNRPALRSVLALAAWRLATSGQTSGASQGAAR